MSGSSAGDTGEWTAVCVFSRTVTTADYHDRYFKQGQYIKMTVGTGTANDTDAPTNQLCTTLANALGVPMTNFGSAPTGKAGELTALKA